MTTKQEALQGIEETVHAKLLKAIGELLNAGWHTGRIASVLSQQGSFGKHVGCHREAILIIANDVCREMNGAEAQIMRDAFLTVKENSPEVYREFMVAMRASRK